jgi:hypothetical protein
MHGDPSLARLFREYGARWEIEHVERGAEWVACQRDPAGLITIVAARDLDGLRYKIGQAEQEDAVEQGGRTREEGV